MELRINDQTVRVVIHAGEKSLSAQDIRVFERVDHILRANPKFQARYPKASLESAAFDAEQQSKMRLSYTSKRGHVEFEATVAFITVIDLKRHTVMLAP